IEVLRDRGDPEVRRKIHAYLHGGHACWMPVVRLELWNGARGDRYPEFSPAHNITSDDPPAIIFLGTKDKLIPVSVAERFKANMAKAGVRCELRLYEDQEHGFFNAAKGGGRYFHETLKASDEFLASLGWLQGPPKLKAP
ncbi:MAG: prolyl oligopeptidase family serine peptidase, partial [Rhodobacteraceae bacterium]|nr:prolyl oligopeptidase family serine peptidase [Paracoccaceae bacterium]